MGRLWESQNELLEVRRAQVSRLSQVIHTDKKACRDQTGDSANSQILHLEHCHDAPPAETKSQSSPEECEQPSLINSWREQDILVQIAVDRKYDKHYFGIIRVYHQAGVLMGVGMRAVRAEDAGVENISIKKDD